MRRLRSFRVPTFAVAISCLVLVLTSCGSQGDPRATSGGNTGTPSTGSPSTGSPSTTAPSSALSAPAGYTKQQLIFDDKFSGTRLDTSKWNSYVGAQGERWDDHGALMFPYSGPNTPITDEAAMFGPSQVNVDDGLTLTASRNTGTSASLFPWISGVITTEGKFSLPSSGWYVQVVAKMPDQSQGMWPAIWFLPGVPGTAYNELDGYEGGWLGAEPNQTMHSDYFSDQGQQQNAYNVGADVTAGYHTYGFHFVPGQSITAYFDGRQVWQVSATNGVTVTSEPYEIIIELQVATQETSDHTVPIQTTPSASMQVREVQAYS